MAAAGAGRRILMVEFFGRGGLLHYSWQLGRGLQRAGAQVTLLTGPRPEAGPGGGVEVRPGLWTWNPHFCPRGVPRRLVRAWRGMRYVAAWVQVLRAVKKERPDLVLFGDFEHRCDAWFIRRLRRGGTRLADVWHNVEAFDRSPGRRVVRRVAWRDRLAGEFDAVFVHGEGLARQLRERSGVAATVIPHGDQGWMAERAGPDPDLDRRLELPPGRAVALLFGSLTKYKGIGVLLEALAALPEERRPVAVVAGMAVAGVSVQELRARAKRLGVGASLRWAEGYVPLAEVAWYFRRADVVVLPYVAASQSGVAHLALTFRKPLIVTRVGGLPELIDGNGVVVEAGDAAGLAEALGAVCGDGGLRARMGERAGWLARERHGWDRVAERVLGRCFAAEEAAAPPPGGRAAA